MTDTPWLGRVLISEPSAAYSADGGVLAGCRPRASAMEPILSAWIRIVVSGVGDQTMPAGIRS
ncbi:hypothetical protein V1283_008415 [Bradyrhizobium sp. AZCC 2262]